MSSPFAYRHMRKSACNKNSPVYIRPPWNLAERTPPRSHALWQPSAISLPFLWRHHLSPSAPLRSLTARHPCFRIRLVPDLAVATREAKTRPTHTHKIAFVSPRALVVAAPYKPDTNSRHFFKLARPEDAIGTAVARAAVKSHRTHGAVTDSPEVLFSACLQLALGAWGAKPTKPTPRLARHSTSGVGSSANSPKQSWKHDEHDHVHAGCRRMGCMQLCCVKISEQGGGGCGGRGSGRARSG